MGILICKIILYKNFDFQNNCTIFAQTKGRMRIVSHKRLRDFYRTKGREDARIALERWYHIALKAEWKNLSDIKVDFPAVDYVGNQHFVFNIGGNKYRLVVVIKFTMGYLFVRFVGTHQEYDKIDCSTI
jgi:mRNA interferase HigB